jgi:hypothetical protein
MPQHNPCVFVVKSTVFSLLGGFILSTHPLPNRAQWLETATKVGDEAHFPSTAVQNSLANRRYTPAQINYFLEVALKSEYGNSQPMIKKWERDINIKVLGSPTPEDLRTLQSVIDELNTLVSGIQLQIVSVAEGQNPHVPGNSPNLEIYFVPESKFSHYEPNYQPLNYGFFWDWWNDDKVIQAGRIMISTVGITQQERSHLIREELTQSLGLMEDSEQYRDSIFYQGWTDTTHYAAIDKVLIEMLYRPEIRPGMTKSQVLKVFQTLNAQKEPTSNCGSNNTQLARDFLGNPSCDTR